jgi:uncharacterized membrane protein YraQ (UPF0718 family)
MTTVKPVKLTTLQIISRIIVAFCFLVMLTDIVYMNIAGIAGGDHSKCVLFSSMPKWCFYLLENVVELVLVVIIGVMFSVIVEQYFRKIKRFYPRNQLLAFLYAAILPVCSCGVIPLIDSMRRRTTLRVIITFVCAAPLLDPYVVFLSYTVLGLKYTIVRVVSSFVLAMLAGWVVEFFARRFHMDEWQSGGDCKRNCDRSIIERDPYVKTLKMTKTLLPYILIGGGLSFAFAMFDVKDLLGTFDLNREPFAAIILTAFGIPIYMCHGADVLFLKPFLQYTDLSIGSAMAFSLSTSAICVSSIVMLAKYLGKRLAATLTIVLFVLIVLTSVVVNMIM